MSAPRRFEYDLVCIGSGPAGQRAAVQAAKLGKRVAVIERRNLFGGVCIETGTIPSKTFREAVKSYVRVQQSSAAFGFRLPKRPSAEMLLQRVSGVVHGEADTVVEQLQRNDVELIQGAASFVDEHTLKVQGPTGDRIVTTSNTLIAVGTRPANPDGVDTDGEVILTSDHVPSLDRLPRTLAVVGSGVIGVEYASMFAVLGVKVTLIDKRERPLEFLDREISDELVHRMRANHVTFLGGEAVEEIAVLEGTPKRGGILLESGKCIVADAILFSVGRQAATDTLGLENIDLKPDKRGRIPVGEHYQTDVPGVFAAGDVIGYPALAATSSEQGRLAACRMFGLPAPPMAEHYPVGIYAIPEVSMVGATEEELTREKVPYETGVARFGEIARGQILGDDSGFFKMIFHRHERTLLGIHCIGTGATELVHVGQAVLALGGGLDYFVDNVFNYPTLAECYKVAAFNALNKIQTAEAFDRLKSGKERRKEPRIDAA
ncbi:MAG: Si-specific NAD(P)(+) transhydrogenase [Planctomycetota bacterium]|jgi:NAD(P) transhydrogenase